MVNHYIENEYYLMQKCSGIILTRFAEGLVYDFEVAAHVDKDYKRLKTQDRHLILSDLRYISYWTVEAQSFWSNNKRPAIKAKAVMLPASHVGRVWEQFFRRFNSLQYPFNFCMTEEESFSWLSTYLD